MAKPTPKKPASPVSAGKHEAPSKKSETAAPPAQPRLPQMIFPALDARLKAWVGPDSAYQREAARLAEMREAVRKQEAVTEFEARKLEALLARVEDPAVERAMAAQWYDADLRQLLLNHLPTQEIETLVRDGGGTEHVRVLLRRLCDALDKVPESEALTGFEGDRVAAFGGLALLPENWESYLFHLAAFKLEDNDHPADAIREGDDLLRDILRVLEIPTREEAARRKADAKSRAKSSAAELKAVDRGFQQLQTAITAPAKGKGPAARGGNAPKPIRKADKAGEGKAVAKAMGVTPAAPKPAKPAAAKGAIKAAKIEQKDDGGFTVSYRKDGHTRSTTIRLPGNGATWTAEKRKAEAIKLAASTLSIDPSLVAVKGEVRGGWHNDDGSYATQDRREATPTPPSPTASGGNSTKPARTRDLPDGHYLFVHGGSWYDDEVVAGKVKDRCRMCDAETPVEDVIRKAARVLQLDPKDFRVLDDDALTPLEGTAADLLKAEAELPPAPAGSDADQDAASVNNVTATAKAEADAEAAREAAREAGELTDDET